GRSRVRRRVRHDRRGGERAGRAISSREVASGGPGAVARVRVLDAVTSTRVSFVDVYVVRQAPPPSPSPGGFQVLVLRRSPAGRSPGSWETVHGTIEPGETPGDAALRELREETGCAPLRLYNAS